LKNTSEQEQEKEEAIEEKKNLFFREKKGTEKASQFLSFSFALPCQLFLQDHYQTEEQATVLEELV
jgi:hypothetical protein